MPGETVSVILKTPPALDHLLLGIVSAVSGQGIRLVDIPKPFHVTLAYASGVPMQVLPQLVPKLQALVSYQTFPYVMGPVEEMTNPDGDAVVFLRAESHQLEHLADRAHNLLEDAGGHFVHDKFRGHMTLGYKKGTLSLKQKAALRSLHPRIPAQAESSVIDISRKSGEGWVVLGSGRNFAATKPKPAPASRRAHMGPAACASCPKCGYYIEVDPLKPDKDLRDAAYEDGARVDWLTPGLIIDCPQCGAGLEIGI